MPRPHLPEALRDQPFNLATAAQHGLTRHMLQGPAWRQVFNGIWVHASVPDSRELRLQAAGLLLGTRGFFCGPTAAWMWGIDVQAEADRQIWMGTEHKGSFRLRTGLMIKELSPLAGDVVELSGLPVTSPTRTCFDCSRWQDLRTAVVVLDSLSHAGRTSPAALRSYLESVRSVPGQRKIHRVIDLSDPKSESPRETWLRLALRRAGLTPVSQWEVTVGELSYRLDLAFPDKQVAVEYDGADHWGRRRFDDQRRDFLRAAGWTIIVVSAVDLATPAAEAELVAKVRSALTR